MWIFQDRQNSELLCGEVTADRFGLHPVWMTATAALKKINCAKPNALKPTYGEFALPGVPDGPLCPEEKKKLIAKLENAWATADANYKAANKARVMAEIALKRGDKGVTEADVKKADDAFHHWLAEWRKADAALKKAMQIKERADCQQHSMYLPKRAPGEEYGFAVQTPEECIATTYYVSTTLVTGDGNVAENGDGITIGPREGPVSGRPEEENVPECAKLQPPAITSSAPRSPITETPPKKPSPITVTETPPKPAPEKPDLGLVKAKELVVKLVVKGKETGKAYEGAAVKLVDAAPALPAAGKEADPALISAKAYKDDEFAGYSDKNGTVSISLSPADTAGDMPKKDAKKGTAPTAGITLSEVTVDENPKAQLVITMTAVDEGNDTTKHTATDEAKAAAKDGSAAKKSPVTTVLKSTPRLPVSLAVSGSGLCVDHRFEIGKQVVFVTRVAKSLMDEVRRKAEHTEGVYSVEEDPCRGKEAIERARRAAD